ncbi:MAG: Hsp20/alpha crystallin family protein [Rhodothermales bacterium]
MTKIVRFSPGRDLARMQNEFDRIFNDFFPGQHRQHSHSEAHSAWSPLVDLSENEDGYSIILDLPGMNKKDIAINFQDGVLTVSGEKAEREEKEGHNFLRTERRSGVFSRSFKIPNAIQTDKISAAYKDGVLNITLLKAEEVKPIKVKVA